MNSQAAAMILISVLVVCGTVIVTVEKPPVTLQSIAVGKVSDNKGLTEALPGVVTYNPLAVNEDGSVNCRTVMLLRDTLSPLPDTLTSADKSTVP